MHLFASAFLHVKQLLLLNTNSIKSPDFSNRIIYAIVTHFGKLFFDGHIPSNGREQRNHFGGYGVFVPEY